MIFLMSKRVFLNVFCPMTDKSVILNANYYIADCRSPGNVKQSAGTIKYVDGEWINLDEETTNNDHLKRTSQYNVKYGNDCIDPAPYVTTLISDTYDTEDGMQIRMRKTMESFVNMRSQMEEIYTPVRRGNGLLFIIYMHDDNIVNFGDIICQHLVDHFGEPITFLDPKYRPNVRGKVLYECHDMNYVHKVNRELNDAITVYDFLAAVGQSPDIEGSVNNMSTFLAGIDKVQDMIHLYELLWPDEPLPVGKYTLEHVREIIMGKILDSKRGMVPQQSRLNIIDVYDPDNY